MWHFTSLKTAGESHLSSIICSDAGLPSIPAAWTMSHSNYLQAEYQANHGPQSDLCLNFIRREHFYFLYLRFSPSELLFPRNNNLHNSVLNEAHDSTMEISKTYHTSCSPLPSQEYPPPFPITNKSRMECKHCHPNNHLFFASEQWPTRTSHTNMRRLQFRYNEVA